MKQDVLKKRKIPRQVFFNPNIRDKITELTICLANHLWNCQLSTILKPTNHTASKHINSLLKTFKVQYKLKIQSFSTHTFRKTFGRYVYDHSEKKDESLVLLNTIFKHSSIETTKRYIGIHQEEIKSIFNLIKI